MSLQYTVGKRGEWLDISFIPVVAGEEEACITQSLGGCQLKIDRKRGDKLRSISIPRYLLVENYEISTVYSQDVDIHMLYFVPRQNTYIIGETKDYLLTVMMNLSREGKLVSFELMGFLF